MRMIIQSRLIVFFGLRCGQQLQEHQKCCRQSGRNYRMSIKGIYDIHCHIVPGVDDGATDIGETVKLLRMEYEQGVRTVIATPHFRFRMFETPAEVVGNSSYDFIKLSHHGSVRNLSEEWSGKIKCQTYMICADGSTHPDKQTIAKLLKWNDEITIYGSTDWWTSMLNIEEQAKLEKIHFEEGEYLWKLPKKE